MQISQKLPRHFRDEWYTFQIHPTYESIDVLVFIISCCRDRVMGNGKERNKRSAIAVGGGLSPVYKSAWGLGD